MGRTQFIYLTDSHIGGDTTGYQMQPRLVGRETELFESLAGWIKSHEVSFVVHGGDLTDHGRPDEIEFADSLCESLGVPVYLCLGNHDVGDPDAMRSWRRSRVWSNPQADCEKIDTEGVRLVLVSHHWHPEVDSRWFVDQLQQPRLTDAQIDLVVQWVSQSDRPVIGITHAPLNDVETGVVEEAFHPPNEHYLATWRRIAEASDGKLKLVMAGHNHVHSLGAHNAFVSCTTSAFSEPSAQFRLVTIDSERLTVETHSLAGYPAACGVDAWCVGVEANRTFRVDL